jgi:hypothetical protein
MKSVACKKSVCLKKSVWLQKKGLLGKKRVSLKKKYVWLQFFCACNFVKSWRQGTARSDLKIEFPWLNARCQPFSELPMTGSSGGITGDSLPGRKGLIGYEPVKPPPPPPRNPAGETFQDSQGGWAWKTKLDGLCLRPATVSSLLHRSTMLSSRNWGFLSSAFVRLRWIQCWLCHLTSTENQPMPLGICLSCLARWLVLWPCCTRLELHLHPLWHRFLPTS